MLELLDLTQTRGVQSEDNASGLSGISKQEVVLNLNRYSSHVSRRAKVRAAKMPLMQPSTFHCNHTIIQDCL